MTWVWRGLAAFASLLVLVGVGVAAATGPTSVAPRLGPSGAVVPGPADTSARPLPTGTAAPGDAPVSNEPIPLEQRPVAVFLGDSITRGATVDTTCGEVTE